MKEKPHNNGQWTAARFRSFITSALRSATYKWGPIQKTRKRANTKWGYYMCNGYNRSAHEVTASIKVKGKKVNNAVVDHIDPVVDPAVGFQSWDIYIDRLFCELDGLQLLCHKCHTAKTADERKRRNK